MPKPRGSVLFAWIVPAVLVACGPQYVSRSQQVPPQGSHARIVAHSNDLRKLDAMRYFQRPLMARLGAFGVSGTAYFNDTQIIIDTPEHDPAKLARVVRALSNAGYYVIRDREGRAVDNFRVKITTIISPTPECGCIAHWIVEVEQPAAVLRGPLALSVDGSNVDIPLVTFLKASSRGYALDVRLEATHEPFLDKLLIAFAGPSIPGLHDVELHAATQAAPRAAR